MKDNTLRKTTIITTVVCIIPVVIGIILYNRLPDRIVTHWAFDGTPNGWQPKFVGAILFPGILVIVNLIFPLLLKIDPKYSNLNQKVKQLLHWIIPVVCVFCSGSTLTAALGKEVNIPLIGPLFLGLLFIAIGNYLPKISQSYTVGFKLPWTLNSEENWNRTHRLGGFVWVVGGIAMIIAGLLGFVKIILAIAVIITLIPMVYSYFLYRRGV